MKTARKPDPFESIQSVLDELNAGIKAAALNPPTDSAMDDKGNNAPATEGAKSEADNVAVAEGVGPASVPATSPAEGDIAQPTPGGELNVTTASEPVPGGEAKKDPIDAPTDSDMNVDNTSKSAFDQLSEIGNSILADVALAGASNPAPTQAKPAEAKAAATTPAASTAKPADEAGKAAADAAVAARIKLANDIAIEGVKLANNVCDYLDGMRKAAEEGASTEGGEGEGGAAPAGPPAPAEGGGSGADPLQAWAEQTMALIQSGANPEELIMVIQQLAGAGGGAPAGPAAPPEAAAPPAEGGGGEMIATASVDDQIAKKKAEVADALLQLQKLNDTKNKTATTQAA